MMILEAILLAQLTGTMHECNSGTAESGLKYYSTNCPAVGEAMGGSVSVTQTGPTNCDEGYELVLRVYEMTTRPTASAWCARDLKIPH